MGVGSNDLQERVGELDAINLERLDARSALRERVDTKYIVPRGHLAEAMTRRADAYLILEIDGERIFAYESVYFDTPELRCFHDHVNDRRPRFKTRTRLYRETGACFLEVKVKDAEDVTTKRQREYDVADHGRLVEAGVDFVDRVLRDLADHPAPSGLAPALSTRYRRITLAARDGAERVTFDLDVGLSAMDGREVHQREDLALVETKTEGGHGDFDGLLLEQGCDPVSISKYRLGVGMLLARDPGEASLQPLRSCFA
jgi:hypothetical protein